jgi:hypothetical protein
VHPVVAGLAPFMARILSRPESIGHLRAFTGSVRRRAVSGADQVKFAELVAAEGNARLRVTAGSSTRRAVSSK